MTYPTDAAIEAGAEGLWLCDERSYQDHPMPWVLCCDRYPGTADRYRDMTKAALIAARAAEPMPTMAEFEHKIEWLLETVADHGAYPPADENMNIPEGYNENIIPILDALRSLFRRATGEGVGE